MSQLDPGPIAAFFDKSHWEGFEAEEMLRSISCPVLLIYGDLEKGGELTQEKAEYIHATIPDCVSDFVDGPHWLHRVQSMQTAMIITDFLDSL